MKSNAIIVIFVITAIILILKKQMNCNDHYLKEIKELKNNDDNDYNDKESKLPSLVLMSIYLGFGPYVNYKYLDLTLHSMQYNKDVDFILIHIMDDATMDSDIDFEGIYNMYK